MAQYNGNWYSPTNMKKRKFYRMAEKRFPNEKDREMLKLLAECIRIGGSEEPTKEEMGF